MLMFTKCRFFVDFFGTQTWHGSRTGRCAVILTQNWTSTHFLDNYFERFINGINYSPRGGGCKVVGNTFKETWNNCIMVMGIDDNGTGTHEICFNFAYDMRRAVVENAGDNTPHVDFFQVINGRSDGLDFNWGAIVVGNITTSAPKAVKGAQGLLTTPSSASTGNTVLWMNSWHYGNIYIDGYGQGWTSVNSENGTFKYNTILSPFDTYATDTPPNMGHLGAALARVTDYTCSKNIVGGGASIGRGTGEVSDNIVNLITPSNAGSSRTLVQTYYTATEFGDNLITKAEIIAQLTPKAPAAGYGAVGTGCDHIAQTCSMPDGFTYSRPYALIG